MLQFQLQSISTYLHTTSTLYLWFPQPLDTAHDDTSKLSHYLDGKCGRDTTWNIRVPQLHLCRCQVCRPHKIMTIATEN